MNPAACLSRASSIPGDGLGTGSEGGSPVPPRDHARGSAVIRFIRLNPRQPPVEHPPALPETPESRPPLHDTFDTHEFPGRSPIRLRRDPWHSDRRVSSAYGARGSPVLLGDRLSSESPPPANKRAGLEETLCYSFGICTQRSSTCIAPVRPRSPEARG